MLYKKEFGFQKDNSTRHVILQLADEITDNFKFTLGVYIDFSKAFDTVHHLTLLTKLSYLGTKKRIEGCLKVN